MSPDEIYQLLNGIANMLRGMTLDPAIPTHAKTAMNKKIQTSEESVERIEPELGAEWR